MSLKEVQEQMLKSIYGAQVPADPQFAFYRELTRVSIQEAIDAVYPECKKIYQSLVPSPSWEEVGNDFITQFWPKDFRINWAVQQFSERLKFEPALKELADYEWARFQSKTSRDPNEGDWVNPSLLLRTYQYPIPHWYIKGNREEFELLKKVELFCILIFRDDQTSLLRTLQVEPMVFELLFQCLEGGGNPQSLIQSLAQQLSRPIQETVFLMEPTLRMWVQEGILLRTDGVL